MYILGCGNEAIKESTSVPYWPQFYEFDASSGTYKYFLSDSLLTFDFSPLKKHNYMMFGWENFWETRSLYYLVFHQPTL